MRSEQVLARVQDKMKKQPGEKQCQTERVRIPPDIVKLQRKSLKRIRQMEK